MLEIVKLGILKTGCIGSAPLLEFIINERAERKDIETRIVGTGASMDKKHCEDVANSLIDYKPNFVIVVSPNATLPGPTIVRDLFMKNNIPTIVISDTPTKKIVKNLEAAGFGYIIPEADSMIGARREFLDSVEMALFNSDVIKVLAITGVFNLIVQSIDKVIQAFKNGKKIALPKITVNAENSIDASGLQNPYARSKAMAAYEIAQRVASLSSKGCFVIKEWEKYTIIVAAAHEMMRSAARLADEAREMEKTEDSLNRYPHRKDGAKLHKTRLIEKPEKLDQ